jgi:hypothetical protein
MSSWLAVVRDETMKRRAMAVGVSNYSFAPVKLSPARHYCLPLAEGANSKTQQRLVDWLPNIL